MITYTASWIGNLTTLLFWVILLVFHYNVLAASELGPELKIAILVGFGIFTGTTLVKSGTLTGITLVGSLF